MGKPVFTASKAGSAAYFDALNEYMEDPVKGVLHPKDGFICKHEKACRESCGDDRTFHPGQLHHVGEYYAMERNGKPFRIVISGAEYGDASEHESIKKRTRGIQSCGKCIPPYPDDEKLNAHMRGTLFLLQLLFEKGPMNPVVGEDAVHVDMQIRTGQHTGDSSTGEEVVRVDMIESSVNIFKTFSMTNFLLCSARSVSKKQEIQRGAYTSTMQEMCQEHYKNALEILKPQIIILQGTRSYGFWSDEPYGKELSWDPARESGANTNDFWREHKAKDLSLNPPKIERVKLANCEKETLILPLCHPSQWPFWSPRNWGWAGSWATSRYIKPAVESLLKEYEKIYG